MAAYEEYLIHWTKGDESAAQLIREFGRLQHIADDFIDDEISADVGSEMRARSDAMTALLVTTLVNIPLNSFYIKHSVWLMPVITSVLVQVNCADRWYDSDTEEERLYSFVWRTAAEQLIYQIAFLVGGLAHAQGVAREYRHVWLETDDDHSYKLWKKEHT